MTNSRYTAVRFYPLMESSVNLSSVQDSPSDTEPKGLNPHRCYVAFKVSQGGICAGYRKIITPFSLR